MKNLTEYIYLSSLISNINTVFPLPETNHVMEIFNVMKGNISEEENNYCLGIIKQANIYSLGTEDNKSSELNPPKFMSCISEYIKKGAKAWDDEASYKIPLVEMELSSLCFPTKTNENIRSDINAIRSKFMQDINRLTTSSPLVACETLLNLLFKYAHFIPYPNKSFNDISLYDYCRISAALAISLHLYDISPERKDPFLLIGGDFSGIQNYIYQIVSKYASKNLKGRSFYLRILSDSIVRLILKQLGLFQTNIIYNSGGSFYIIAPNTKKCTGSLSEIIHIIEEKLYFTHKTTLYTAIDYIELSTDELMQKNGRNLTSAWINLFQKREHKKNTKFVDLIENNYVSFFNASDLGGNTCRDSITGEEIDKNEESYYIEGIGTLKATTYSQIEIGQALKATNNIIVSTSPIKELDSEIHINPCGLGFYYYLVSKNAAEKASESISMLSKDITIITLNGHDEKCDFMPRNPLECIYSLEFYGGNVFSYQTFGDLCDKGNDAAFERLGVLRMDVDNLGNLFQQGICSEKAIFARYASFSRAFDYFFSGYLNTIQQDIAPYSSFIIYSGGDDVFIVGSWDDTLKIAEKIREDFRVYTCHNHAFSISGGIAIIPHKYPIMKGAEESAIEEENAKEHICCGYTKNSISFLNMALNWDYEYPAVKKLKDNIVRLTERNELPKSFISKILMHLLNTEIEGHDIKTFKTYWMLTYDLSRMVDRSISTSVKLLIENCKSEICSNNRTKLNGENIMTDYHPLELWALSARWAELEIRTNK